MHFVDNLGSIAGAMLVLDLNTKTHSQTVIKSSTFDSNESDQKCHGSGLVLLFNKHSRASSTNEIYQPLKVVYVQFTFSFGSPFRDEQEGVVYIATIDIKKTPISFTFSNVTFNKNKSLLSGHVYL